MALMGEKDNEIEKKNAAIKGYIEKIVDLTQNAESKDARIRLLESELEILSAANDRFVQEKENLEKRNSLLNEELTTKDNNLIQVRKEYGEYEADMSAKLEDREWAEVKRELQEQRDLVMQLSFEHGSTLKDALKELTDALRSVANAKSRAAVAEDSDSGDGDVSSSTEKADEVKRSLEDEIRSLRERVNELDSECKLKTEEVISATAGKEEPLLDEQIQVEHRDTVDAADEKLDKPSDSMLSDDQLRDQTAQDMQRIVAESGGEREEGELVADFADNDGDNNTSNETGGPGNAEFQGEQSAEPEKSPSTEPLVLEAGEIDPSQTPDEEKVGDITENIFDGSDKLNEVADSTTETDRASGSSNPPTEEASTRTTVPKKKKKKTSTTVDVGSLDQGGSTPSQDSGGKPVSPLNSGSTTINRKERGRQRASLRQAEVAPSPGGAPVGDAPSPGRAPVGVAHSPGRARGQASHGRVARGGHAGRGQSPG
ncbi:hypothetical protein C2S51_009874 [Perilla frutescens var. frutescens]|nr:hypothetical protein C2S51_009874 [Perilla frutescens var. frutescens]